MFSSLAASSISGAVDGVVRDAKKTIASPEFLRAKEIATHKTTFERYGAYFVPCIVLSIMGCIFLIYWFNRGKTESEQKQADSIFTGVMSALGIAFALAGIYSMPYLTGMALESVMNSYGAAIVYFNTGIAPPNFKFGDGSFSDKCGKLITHRSDHYKTAKELQNECRSHRI